MKQFIILTFFILISNTSLAGSDIATRFLDALDSDQRLKALLKQDSEKRTEWHFFPPTMFEREGIPLKELNAVQTKLLHELLQTYLSESGYKKAMGAIEIEGILRDLTKDPVFRDTGRYHTTFYGEPTSDKPWSWGFEGHHVSLNFTVDGENVSYVPMFYGANPGIVTEGPKKGHRSLVNEEDLGLELINMLDKQQQKQAIFNASTFNDIISLNSSEVSPMAPVGLKVSAMKPAQQALLFRLVNEYISSVPQKAAKERMNKITAEALDNIYFGWAGAKKLGKAHYYRIQGKSFLIEFDNSQNNANHIHVVWRDFKGDFGRDLIREHYHTSSHHH